MSDGITDMDDPYVHLETFLRVGEGVIKRSY